MTKTTTARVQRHPMHEALIADLSEGSKREYLPFWGPIPTSGKIGRGCLCQWWDSPFVINGDRYWTAEHYLMAEKARLFGDYDAMVRIIASRDPSEAQYLGRHVKNYQEQRWADERFGVAVRGNLRKFAQHPELLDYLLATDHKVLVSANPTDRIWSIGYDEDHEYVCEPDKWRGLNLLGFALMLVRQRLATHPS